MDTLGFKKNDEYENIHSVNSFYLIIHSFKKMTINT